MEMKEYELVCGGAFEDLTTEEMMEFDGSIGPITLSVILNTIYMITEMFFFPRKAY